jgi:hypothetical protein
VGLAPTARSSRKVTPPLAVGGGSTAGNTFFTTGSRGDSIPPVMIRFSQPDAKSGAGLEEDLFVMARVISRTLEKAEAENLKFKMGIPMLLTGSGRSVRPMYIEGLGPLFMIKVNFALLPAPKTGEKKANAPAPDTEWQTAHQEVFGSEEVNEEYSARTSSYKEEQVELLKKELIGALKNAANIRGLKADEFVNIAVFGHASSPSNLKPRNTTEFYNPIDGPPAKWEAGDLGTFGAGKGSVLTLRARKSDIDAFAGGKLDADAFRSKVATTAYFGTGSGVTSINSWIQESAGRLQVR